MPLTCDRGYYFICMIHNISKFSIRFTERRIPMKEKLHIKNTFQTTDLKLLQKTVTAKIQKLINIQVKK